MTALLIVQQIVQTNSKENIALHYWPLVKGTPQPQMASPHKVILMCGCFVMLSPYIPWCNTQKEMHDAE